LEGIRRNGRQKTDRKK